MNTKKDGKLSSDELKFLKAMHYSGAFEGEDRRRDKDGFIYLVKDNASNRVKIGITTNHVDRLRSLNRMVPYGITTISIFPSRNYEKLEKEVHERYKEKRRNGEWFDFTDDDLKDCLEYLENNDVR